LYRPLLFVRLLSLALPRPLLLVDTPSFSHLLVSFLGRIESILREGKGAPPFLIPLQEYVVPFGLR
jgi:hypothetical protein